MIGNVKPIVVNQRIFKYCTSIYTEGQDEGMQRGLDCMQCEWLIKGMFSSLLAS